MGDSGEKRKQIDNSQAPKKQAKNSGDNANGDGDRIVSPKELLIQLFESGTGDWEMIGSDGVAVKFHQAILSEQVAHFKTLFSHTGTMECENKQIAVPEDLNISGADVKAFLGFIYFQDMKPSEDSFQTTCALLRMAHYYNTVKLANACTKTIQSYLGQEKLHWFSVPELWTLFRQVWLWEETHPNKMELMDYIVEIIKKICQNKEDAEMDKLLPVTGGDPILRDLIIKLVQVPPKPQEPTQPLQQHELISFPTNISEEMNQILELYRAGYQDEF